MITAIYLILLRNFPNESAICINVKHFRYDVNDKDDALTNDKKSRKKLRTPLWIRLVSIKIDRGSVRYVSNGNTFKQEALPIRLNIRIVAMLLIYFT